jgi:hypothetical protein
MALKKTILSEIADLDPEVSSGLIDKVIKKSKKKSKRRKKSVRAGKSTHVGRSTTQTNYPRHSVERALRVPKAILEQNAGKECTPKEAAVFVGVGYGGDFAVEVSSSTKYGFLERPTPGQIRPTELVKRVLRPQDPTEETNGFREAILNAPVISDVYQHYRGENLPDRQFLDNALIDKFGIPQDKAGEFNDIFLASLEKAKLLEKVADKVRLLDISTSQPDLKAEISGRIKKLGQAVSIKATDSCFVMMSFAPPHGDYYKKIYEPAIGKAGLNPFRADADIFGTGKIMDQIWSGINAAKVLVAELTKRNPNVFYELGLAHALQKPVVLVSSNEEDVPFDLQHIRVIYYDVNDPFWGEKLIEKVAENILSAIRNPEEAVFKRVVQFAD